MRHTNINIESPKGYLFYYLEYEDDNTFVEGRPKYLIDANDGKVFFYDGNYDVINRHENEWTPYSTTSELVSTYTPDSYNLSTINIYFPRFSVETYVSQVKYALDVYTYVHGTKINLASYLIDRNNVVACNGVKRFSNEEYYEYLSVKIIDPWFIAYSDEWKMFRQVVCGEEEQYDETGSYELNSTGSIIHVTLHPVTPGDDGIYREMDNYLGGQNAINLSETDTDYLAFNITDNHRSVSFYESGLAFRTDAVYNDAYEKTPAGFREYIKETYQLDTYSLWMEVVIQDDENIYKYFKQEVQSPWQEIGRDELVFDSWDGYHEGMFLNVSLELYAHRPQELDAEDAIIYLKSNRINLTEDLFKYMVGENPIDKVYLESVDMKNYNINAVNKIQQNIVQMDRPDDYKANIIKPVFFRTRELANLILHPAVTENICINLDQYKAKVDSFILRVEDTSFVEYGRTASGVIFKVVGANLANSQASGTYYILNQDSELVTTGQYTYEQ